MFGVAVRETGESVPSGLPFADRCEALRAFAAATPFCA